MSSYSFILRLFCCIHKPSLNHNVDVDVDVNVKINVDVEDELIDYKQTIPFVPPIHDGYVVKVYDGDTITIASKLPYKESPLYRFQVRLNGIDCPEIKGQNEYEKKVALMAKLEITNLVLHKRVT